MRLYQAGDEWLVASINAKAREDEILIARINPNVLILVSRRLSHMFL